MFKTIFTKWKTIGKYHTCFVISIVTNSWALPIRIEWNKYKVFIQMLCLHFIFDRYKLEQNVTNRSNDSDPWYECTDEEKLIWEEDNITNNIKEETL